MWIFQNTWKGIIKKVTCTIFTAFAIITAMKRSDITRQQLELQIQNGTISMTQILRKWYLLAMMKLLEIRHTVYFIEKDLILKNEYFM